MSEPTFSELLSAYLQRSGISDSALARSIGVRRQTIFRWKEGLVERPRAREDVLRCAQKLRLTPVERDRLLLAAGFAPEELAADVPALTNDEPDGREQVAVAVEDGAIQEDCAVDVEMATVLPAPTNAVSAATEPTLLPAETDPPAVQPPAGAERPPTPLLPPRLHTLAAWRRQLSLPLKAAPLGGVLLLGFALTILLIIVLLFWRLPQPLPSNPTPPPVQVTLYPPATSAAGLPAIHPRAATGETLLVVVPFRGYTTNEQYNVAGRIRDALAEEIAAAQVLSITIATWPEAIDSAAQLAPVLAASEATLVIWGEYDSGRVRVNLDGQRNITVKRDFPLSSPAELITTITSTLPREIRMLALTVLGRLLRNQGDLAAAAVAFNQALRLQPDDPKTEALLNFYLGHLAEQRQTQADLASALDHYSTALAMNPRLLDAQYNRGNVQLRRAALLSVTDPQFDEALSAAIVDFSAVIEQRPGSINAYLNRGVAHYERNAEGDQAAAITDFQRIIAVEPADERAYFHRALALLRGDGGNGWVADFEQVLQLRPDYYPALNGLCWGYALNAAPEEALPYCDAAVALDPTGASRDSRAIAHAQLGHHAAAIADFTAYLDWLQTLESATLYTRYRGPVVEEWIVQLEAEQNPFDRALLDSLR